MTPRPTAMAAESGAAATAAIVGCSAGIERVRRMICKFASATETTVLVTGESGTGKGLAAWALHAASARCRKPFMNVTCSALPTALLESELFGHERGAFTDAKTRHLGLLEQAQGGTVFLDEIGDMDPALQAKILRVLEEKRYRRIGGTEDLHADVRIVAATNVDLLGAVRSGRFREDLYYRLAVLLLQIPALRERREDIEPLVHHFVASQGAESGHRRVRMTPEVLRALEEHDWPGNVRELRNVLERALILADGDTIDIADLQLGHDRRAANWECFALPSEGLDIAQLERDLVMQALERTSGNVTHAARLLGMSRDQVRYRIKKLALHEDRRGPHEHR